MTPPRALLLLLISGASLVHALPTQDPVPAPDVEADAPAEPGATEVIEVRLTPHVPEDRIALRWSPKGAKLELALAGGALAGELLLGPSGEAAAVRPLHLELSKSDGAAHLDRLWLDRDGDRVRDVGEVLETTPSETRGKFWSSFETVLMLPLPGDAGTRPYPLSFWFVEDPLEPDAKPVLRWSRRGWHAGSFPLGDARAFLLIADDAMDGTFDWSDAWWLSSDGASLVSGAKWRSLGRHAWLGEAAYRMVELDPHGRWIRIEPFDPGETRAEEEAREDLRAADRMAPRAESPLPFEHDYEAAAAAALAAKRPLLVDFETVWCGPCKIMDQVVYTAAKVVGAAEASGVVAVKVDGDERRDLKQEFGVDAFPTMILISAEGVELRRLVGYQSVEAMSAFLTIEP